jgi:hypothetical protein
MTRFTGIRRGRLLYVDDGPIIYIPFPLMKSVLPCTYITLEADQAKHGGWIAKRILIARIIRDK